MDVRTTLKLVVFIGGALLSTIARPDSAIAESATGVPYASWNERNIEDARRNALEQCRDESGQECTLLDTSPRDTGGFASVAQSATHITWAIGFVTQDEANRVAMRRCSLQTEPGETCEVSLTYLDRHRFNPLATSAAPVYIQVR